MESLTDIQKKEKQQEELKAAKAAAERHEIFKQSSGLAFFLVDAVERFLGILSNIDANLEQLVQGNKQPKK